MNTPIRRRYFIDMYTVLIICDDASAADVSSLRAYLELSDLRTVVCDDSRQSLSAISRNMVDIAVLVSRGGAVDGFMTIRRLREKSDMPVVVLAEHSDESDRIMAFELGCDDIISSPFSYKEIVLRLKARLKRRDGGSHEARHVFRNGDRELVVDTSSHKVIVDGAEVDLTASEWRIFSMLVANCNSVVSRSQIISACFGYASESYDRVVDTHIKNIRSKLGDDGRLWIGTARGYGYCFTASESTLQAR